ncbi:MAG: formylglycine-generating enzyme family protein, partial [Planctomycetes bacterium]|nr:formylglycine-generating enzyme family protein [Planctomycetota bacterium]
MDTSFCPSTAPVKTLFVVLLASLFIASPALALSPEDSLRQSPCPPDQAAMVPPGMVYIPGGSATIGFDAQEIQDRGVEVLNFLKTLAASVPRHEVQLEPYFIDRNEVTNLQWKIYLDLNSLEPSKDLIQYSWTDGKIPAGQENMPVVCVSHREAEEFARWAWKRLPTEEEWEYAARGPEALLWPWGNEFSGDKAWCADSKPFIKHGQAVGTKLEGKSPFGVFDLAGNVWEWTASPFEAYPKYADIQIKTKYSRGKPEKISAAEFFSSTRRVIRGGAFDSNEVPLLSAVRQYADPSTWYNTVGFRCARSARPGVDAVRRAVAQAGPQHFHDYPIDYASILSLEVTHHDGQGLVTGNQGIVFAPVKTWKNLTEMQKLSRRGPVAVGVLLTTENMIEPTIVAGAYVVAYKVGETKANGNGAAAKLFPVEGWTYRGWESHDPTLEARTTEAARKKSAADKKAARAAKKE